MGVHQVDQRVSELNRVNAGMIDGVDNLHTRSAESVSAPLPFSSLVAPASM
jgi:hypothetical protein